MAAGSALPPLPLSSRPGALSCRLMGLVFSLATGKKKEVSAPGCFSSISCYLPFRICSLVQGIVDYVKSREGIRRQTQRSALSLFQCPLCFAGSVSLSSRKHNCNSGRVSIIFLFAGNKKKPQADMFLKRNPKGYILHTTETRKKKKNQEECLTSSKAFAGQTEGEQNMSGVVIYLLASYCHPCLKTLVSYMLGHLTVMLMSWPVISSGAREGKKKSGTEFVNVCTTYCRNTWTSGDCVLWMIIERSQFTTFNSLPWVLRGEVRLTSCHHYMSNYRTAYNTPLFPAC